MIKRFNRFELKYVIPIDLRDDLLREIRRQMKPDPAGRDGVYEITSQYYDSPDYVSFRSKVDGVKYRRKVRIRLYGPRGLEENPQVMFEIKQRINRTTQKRRVAMKLDEAYRLAVGGEPPQIDDPRDRAVMQEIGFLSHSLHLQPACVVAYVRQAFVGSDYETGMRLTFDHAIWCNNASAGVQDESVRHFMIPPNYTVMEVKANNAVPLWVSRMLARHRVPLSRFSKYCGGVSCLYQLGGLHMSAEDMTPKMMKKLAKQAAKAQQLEQQGRSASKAGSGEVDG